MKNTKEIALGEPRSDRTENRKTHTVALNIAATFTAEPIQETIAFWLDHFGTGGKVSFSPYNQVFQTLLNESTRSQYDAHAILVRLEDWVDKDLSEKDTLNELEAVFQDFSGALKFRRSLEPAAIFVAICPPSASFHLSLHERLQEKLILLLDSLDDIYVLPYQEVLNTYPVAVYSNPHADALGNIPYSPDFFAALGTMLYRKVHAWRYSSVKVVVLDCDNTLWGGVCGEDGTDGIVLDEGRRALQQFFLEKSNAGILLCLCSKNNEQDVQEVFQKRADMQLSLHDITASKINWHPKSENLKALSEELQLGLDSFLFIDDSPVECEEVRTNCPEVITLQLPDSSGSLQHFLEHIWVLDKLNITQEDQKRAAFYRQNVQREHVRSQSLNLRSFIDQLQINIDISEPKMAQIGRLAQLTQRTNQFNTTTMRHSEADMRQILLGKDRACFVVHVRDKFGDYGLVGAVIYTIQEELLSVDAMLLSCRALGREVEYKMLRKLGELALLHGVKQVAVQFNLTPKNKPALQFLEGLEGIVRHSNQTGDVFLLDTDLAVKASLAKKTETAESKDDALTTAFAAEKTSEKRISFIERSMQYALIANELHDVVSISSKVDAYHQNERVAQVAYLEPRTPAEKKLARMWERVLKVDRVGINDNFVELGGDSLKGTLLLADIQVEFDVELPLLSIFELSTLAEMSSRIQMLKIESVRIEDIQDALAELGELSESEILRLLNEDASN